MAATRGGTRLISKTICDTAAFGRRFFMCPDQPLLRRCTGAR
ncbi:hypothetical protein RESH_04820 [Rhodopirellula europaea SH398]|uniref:Uncharacterized protein n=1 Tax=Rhodopirellula europaea SH398 TaxID=1263868 RepID=M5SE65_9BACT|nr:hypothetical protein RESH_04820 [Rhodopirellula europaea SH398]